MTTAIIVISIFALCCLGWAIWLFGEDRKRRAELETVNEEKRAADGKKRDLQTQLDTANNQIEDFELQLKTANNIIGNVQIKLKMANTEIKVLKIRLADTEVDKRDAQWLSHLSVVSLQRSVGALCGERRRSARLKRDRDQTIKNYLEFCKRVKEQAEARVVRKGVAVVFSFVPGLGVLDILLDAGDIVGDVTDASEAIEAVSSAVENSTEVFDDIVIEFPRLMTSDDMSVALIQDTQSTFRESFEETFKEDIAHDCVGVLDGSKLEIFVTETLQSTGNLVIQSAEEAYINGVFEKLEDFASEFKDYRELLKEQPEENSDDPKVS